MSAAPDIAVITPTTGRREQVERCIHSVSLQDYSGTVHQLVIGDHLDSDTAREVDTMCSRSGAEFRNDLRPLNTGYAPARTGRLRNLGVRLSTAPLIAHLDDDNTLEPQHLSSLAHLLKDPAVDIAHSWRRMLQPDGRPVHLQRYPWVIAHRDEIAKEVFDSLVAQGIFERGGAVIRDRVPDADGDLYHIDSSEWMMRRSVFDAVSFLENATPRQMIYQYTEDYLFCRDAVRAGLIFACSEKITLNYYLGGYWSCGETTLLEK
ncbi:MAG: glycosyltransferase family A protein [Phycisphaerales bacterium]